jgi:hypothetical protein
LGIQDQLSAVLLATVARALRARLTRKGAKILDWLTSGAEPLLPPACTFWRLVTGPLVAGCCVWRPAIVVYVDRVTVVSVKDRRRRKSLAGPDSRTCRRSECARDEIRLDHHIDANLIRCDKILSCLQSVQPPHCDDPSRDRCHLVREVRAPNQPPCLGFSISMDTCRPRVVMVQLQTWQYLGRPYAMPIESGPP